MPTNRFQFSDDFVLNNGNVGINTATPQAKLDVDGVVKGESLKVTGVSSFTSYEGFLNSNQNITETTTISGDKVSGSLSGEIIVGTGVTASVSEEATSSQGNIDSLKVYNTFTVPVGGTADRPSKATPGQLFFNKDFATMEFWDGDRWRQVDNTTQRGRGVIGGGDGGSNSTSSIQYINISTLGNSQNFGTLTFSREQHQSCSSSTRGLFAGGYISSPGTFYNVIDYITIASEGNAIDFGDLINGARRRMTEGGLSSSTRGVFAGGFSPSLTPSTTINSIEYVQISTIGNSLDFGDLSQITAFAAACSSPTRGVYSETGNSANITTMEAITISSTGNAVKFGDAAKNGLGKMGCSNSVRGIFAGGGSGALYNKLIAYITISTFGNALEFGDLTRETQQGVSTSNSIRGVFAGGYESPGGTATNAITHITISTTGNAQDFGDLTSTLRQSGACSDSHGGLGGF
jgi:hypothetical protein